MILASSASDDPTPFQFGDWQFGFMEIYLAGAFVVFLFAMVTGYIEARREARRVSSPRPYLHEWASRNPFTKWQAAQFGQGKVLVDLTAVCKNCQGRLKGVDLEESALKSEHPPATWRVCPSCGSTTVMYAEFPWTRTRQRQTEERARIEEYLERNRLHKMSTRRGLLKMSPREFEEAVGEILGANGYVGVRVRGGAHDLAVDIQCRDSEGRAVGVQCKRYSDKPVGSREVQMFIGMLHKHHKIERGVYVTTSRYTAPAQELAETHDIELIDGDDLLEMAAILSPSITPSEEKEIRSLEMWKVMAQERRERVAAYVREAEYERRERARYWAARNRSGY